MKLKKFIATVMSGIITMTVFCFPVYPASNSVSITVGGSGFKTIQQAVDSVQKGQAAVITIRPGVYEEAVLVDKPNIRFVNSDKAKKVIITYDRGSGHSDPAKNLGTEKSATVMVTADASGFSAENITFQNTFNIGTEFKQAQAVAFESLADKVVLENCSFIGRQDTLYLKGASKGQNVYGSANPARVYLKNCYIEGTVDFVFGDATAYFEKCALNMVYNENGGHFTAANTTLFNTGYVFDRCSFSTDEKYNENAQAAAKIDLGRPWQADGGYPNFGSSTVLINCKVSDKVKKAGFSTWDSNTVTNKVRYYEYGTTDLKGRTANLSGRDKNIVTVLTNEQAAAYNAYTVLCGSDGWNPSGVKKTREVPRDITLNNYVVKIPQGETANITPFVIGGSDASLSSADESIVKVDDNGKLTAVSSGKTVVTAQTANGFKASADVEVTAPRTGFPVIKDIKIDHISTFEPGTKMTVNYSYMLESDNDTDAARISWYLLKDGREILLKKGVGTAFKSYTIESSDVGGRFKAVVEPSTKTNYGSYGKGVSVNDENIVKGSVKPLIKTGFNEGTKLFATTGEWKNEKTEDNYLITAECDYGKPSSLMFDTDLADPSLRAKLRFNPAETGLSAEDSANIWINYKDGSGYKLNIARGSNTKSLKMYIYKVTSDGEKLLASDETSMKNNVLQNSGEDNPFFYVDLYKKGDTITAAFTLEGSEANLAKISARDTSPLKGGSLYMEFIGKGNIWMLDTLSLESSISANSENAVHVYLAGDSTVKDYGASNTIGGWGEFIGNYFTDNVIIVNKAEGGRSTRSYLNQGRLDEILDQAEPGDYLFIQFGHNDARTDDAADMEHKVRLGTPDEDGIYPVIPAVKTKTPQYIYDFYKNDSYPYTDTFYPYESGTFKWYYEQYVTKAREKGMFPVVITPVCRVFFDADGKITPHFGEDNGYVEAVRQVAKEMNCPLIDMYEITSSLYESYGVLTTQGLHNVLSDGSMDLTHYNKFGANLIASKMAESLKDQNIAIADATKSSNVSVGRVDEMKSASLFVIGDTAADKTDKDDIIPSVSVADKLSDYFVEKISVVDHTKAGTTAKSFANSPDYEKFMSQVKEGDYVVICFGRADGDNSTADKSLDFYSGLNGGSDVKGTFKYFLYNSYIKPLTEKKAVIIMATPIADGTFKKGSHVNGTQAYAEAVKELVVDNSLYFVDLNTQTAELYANMGEDGSKVLNAIDKKTGIERDRLSEFGADTVARAFVNSMKYSSATLKNYINETNLSQPDILTRAEYISALVDVMGASSTSGSNFKDVVSGKSYYNAVLTAKNIGLTKGYLNGTFKPENQLYGNDAVKMLKAALAYKNTDPNKLNDVYELMPISKPVSNEIGLYAAVRLYEVLNG